MKNWRESACEHLESRQLLAADITCAINSTGGGATLERGVQYAATVSITNGGDALGSESQVRVQLYVTQEATFNAGTAIPLTGGSVTFRGSRFPNETTSDTAAFTLPGTLASGTWRMFAWADPEQRVPESNRGNNISTATTFTIVGGGGGGGGTDPLPKIDLTTSIVLLNQSLVTNAPIRLNVTVVNRGDDPVPVTGTFAHVYRTRSTTANPLSDQSVGEPISILQSIPKDGSVTREVSFTMSESDSTGQWRFYSVTDISNQTAETNESNNVSTLVSGQFNFSTKDISGTFAATTIPSQFVQGQKFSKSPTITYTYRNASDFALGRSTSMTVRAFLRPAGSTDAASNIALTSARSESLSNMAPGAERTRTLSVRMPANLAAGTYRLLVELDSTGKIEEINELNNTLEPSGFISVAAPTFDPAIDSVTTAYPSSIKAGKSGKVSLQLTNLGNSTFRNSVSFQFFFLDAAGSEITAPSIIKKLEISTSKPFKLSNLSIKAPTVPGTYTMGVRMTVAPELGELSVFNNVADLGQVVVTA